VAAKASIVLVLDQLDELAVEIGSATNTAITEVGAGELSFPQWRLVAVLGSATGPMRPNEIAARMSASMPSTSRLVHRLRRRGLISSARDPRDGRGRLISLTPKGAALKSGVVARRRALMEACLADLEADPSVVDALASIVQRLVSLA
jgi:DNA-binding MarR family transcriptional regulator